MKILVAEDENVSRLRLVSSLRRRGYRVEAAEDGAEAWALLQAPDPSMLAILDWEMPGTDGVDLCRRIRATPQLRGMYVLLLTARGTKESIVEGLQAGANDYVTKPFAADELDSRLRVASQMMALQFELATRVKELEEALAEVTLLQAMLPICAYCKNVRDDQNYWHKVEQYLADHSGAKVTSGICPSCWDKEIKPQFEKLGKAPPERSS